MADYRVHYNTTADPAISGSVFVPEDKTESVLEYIRENFEAPVWEQVKGGETLPPESLIRDWFISEGLPWP